MIISKRSSYTELRSRAYPAITEQLDAIYKMAAALKMQGIELPTETLDWIDSCKAVKVKFKKT